MGKFKPAKAKRKGVTPQQGGLPCVIVLIAGMALVMLFLYYIMGHANG